VASVEYESIRESGLWSGALASRPEDRFIAFRYITEAAPHSPHFANFGEPMPPKNTEFSFINLKTTSGKTVSIADVFATRRKS